MSSINMTAREKLQVVADGLAKLYPDAGITFGYIGNVYTAPPMGPRDDRGWYIFTRLIDKNDKDISFGGWGTDELDKFLKAADNNIVKWKNRITEVLDAEKAYSAALSAGKSVTYRRFRK